MEATRKTMALVSAVVLAMAMIALVGCDAVTAGDRSDPAVDHTDTFPITVTDDAGRQVTIESEPQRIVSLAPANTEIVYALGLMDRLVGVTSFDDYPPEVSELPVVGDFVGPNVEAVVALDPDLVLGTTGVQADVLGQLEDSGATVLAVDPLTLGGLYDAIGMVGGAAGASDEAEDVVTGMRDEVDRITEAVGSQEPATCFVEIAQEPLFTSGTGTLLHELVTLAGGVNVVSDEGWVGYSVEQLLEDDPHVYLATFGSMSDPSALAERPGYDSLSSVKAGRVFVLTDNLVSRPGPRIVEGLEEIARALHPEAF